MVELMLVILGSIYLGIATPTGRQVGALIAAAIVVRARRRRLFRAVMNTITVSASILFITVGAFIFNYAVQTTGIAGAFARWVIALDLNVNIFLILLFIFYAILGCLVDSIGMIVMTVPLLLPILVAYKVDLIWFGVILVVVVELGRDHAAGGDQSFRRRLHRQGGIGPVIRGVVPYFYIFGIFLLLLLIFPQLATWLPAKM
jgi:TRAP-type C4-dicarboxylate transport system permease large subunit